MKYLPAFTIASLFAFSVSTLFSQITLPPSGDNQKASVTQYMGMANVTVTYSSPNVHGPNNEDRTGKIWGELVPYGEADLGFGYSNASNPSPWRAGANESTIITFSHDTKVEGKLLPAGTYSLHMIPSEKEWTIIFNKNTQAWGSFFYDAKGDALRVTVTPHANAYTEWLTYNFTDRNMDNCTLELQWENLAVPITFSVDNMMQLYADNLRYELTGAKGFQVDSWVNAANWCAQNNINLEEALQWADYAINAPFQGVRNFNTLSCKSNVLQAMGKVDEANAMMREAIQDPGATALNIHFYARGLQVQNKQEEAFEIFKMNYERHKSDPVTHLGMARGYSAKKDYKTALKYINSGLALNPGGQLKPILDDCKIKLENNQDIN